MTSLLPDSVCESIARIWQRGGGAMVERVAVCDSERAAERARRKYGADADVRRSPEGYEVWVRRAS